LIKKPLGLVLSGVLTFGLAACNNNNDAADEVRTSRADRDNTYLTVGNNRDDGIDHNGPLTEDYSNRDNNDPDWDRNARNDDNVTNVNNDRTNNRNNRTRNVNNDRTTNRNNNTTNVNNNQTSNNTNNIRYNPLNRGLDPDLVNVGNNNNNNNNNNNKNNKNNKNNNNNMNDALNLSADRTTLDSRSYPHTKAILIQHAQYRYIPFGSVQWYQFGGQQGQQQGPAVQAPNTQQQGPTGQAPNQQQGPTAPAPAPAPTAPAPAPAPKPAAPAPAPKPAAPAPATGNVSAYVQQVIDLTNAQRSKNGLPALKHDTQLSGVAQKKSLDMAQNNYFSHTSPTYGSPFDMMRDFGVTYRSAGENIAQGQRTPQEVVNAWMNSAGHRQNILSTNFTHIGVGYEKSGNHWTQMFIGK
jgi:uncharacterized YkwD family protein